MQRLGELITPGKYSENFWSTINYMNRIMTCVCFIEFQSGHVTVVRSSIEDGLRFVRCAVVRYERNLLDTSVPAQLLMQYPRVDLKFNIFHSQRQGRDPVAVFRKPQEMGKLITVNFRK